MMPINNLFSSRVVGKVLEKCLEKKSIVVKKNRKNITKWISKMQLSLQKKMSISSKVAFTSKEPSTSDLRLEIFNWKERILRQTESLKKSAEHIIKESKVYDRVDQIETTETKSLGRFGFRAAGITDKFDEITKKLASNLADTGCIQSMEMSITCNADVLFQARQASEYSQKLNAGKL